MCLKGLKGATFCINKRKGCMMKTMWKFLKPKEILIQNILLIKNAMIRTYNAHDGVIFNLLLNGNYVITILLLE